MHRLRLIALSCLLTAQAPWPTPIALPSPNPSPTIQWEGPPAASFDLVVEPLGVTPDGEARAFVRVVFHDAQGNATRVRHGSDFDYFPSRGSDQWQTLLRYGAPGTVVSVRDEGPVAVRVVSNRPSGLPARTVTFDTRTWSMSRVVGGAVGPHLARIGWFPAVTSGVVTISRIDARGGRQRLAVVAPPSSSWSDPNVAPGSVVHYAIARPGLAESRVAIAIPPELPRSSAELVSGKGAWLAFSGDPLDDDGYTKFDVPAIVSAAQRAGLRYVEIRLAYGAFDEVTPAAKPTIDAMIDGLSAAGIVVVGWTVPRAVTYEDVARNAAVAAYRTPAGHAIAGLAVDLERGDEFLGDGAVGYARLATYLHELRRAVGPRVALIATVEDPFLEHLDAAKFPYAAIAADADVLQPMTYWRMLGPWDSIPKMRCRRWFRCGAAAARGPAASAQRRRADAPALKARGRRCPMRLRRALTRAAAQAPWA